MKNKKLGILVALFVISVLFVMSQGGIFERDADKQTAREVEELDVIVIGDVTISVVHADTPEKRTKGLSGTESLGENEGMLFTFDSPGNYAFWMKDMLFPIDIIWINEDNVVTEITRNISPDSFPAIYRAIYPVLYVLEVNTDVSEKNGIIVGDLLQIN